MIGAPTSPLPIWLAWPSPSAIPSIPNMATLGVVLPSLLPTSLLSTLEGQVSSGLRCLPSFFLFPTNQSLAIRPYCMHIAYKEGASMEPPNHFRSSYRVLFPLSSSSSSSPQTLNFSRLQPSLTPHQFPHLPQLSRSFPPIVRLCRFLPSLSRVTFTSSRHSGHSPAASAKEDISISHYPNSIQDMHHHAHVPFCLIHHNHIYFSPTRRHPWALLVDTRVFIDMSSSQGLFDQYRGHIVPQSYNAGFVALSYVVSLVGAASTLELINRRTSFKGLFNQYDHNTSPSLSNRCN